MHFQQKIGAVTPVKTENKLRHWERIFLNCFCDFFLQNWRPMALIKYKTPALVTQMVLIAPW